jgi:hypothetical protein
MGMKPEALKKEQAARDKNRNNFPQHNFSPKITFPEPEVGAAKPSKSAHAVGLGEFIDEGGNRKRVFVKAVRSALEAELEVAASKFLRYLLGDACCDTRFLLDEGGKIKRTDQGFMVASVGLNNWEEYNKLGKASESFWWTHLPIAAKCFASVFPDWMLCASCKDDTPERMSEVKRPQDLLRVENMPAYNLMRNLNGNYILENEDLHGENLGTVDELEGLITSGPGSVRGGSVRKKVAVIDLGRFFWNVYGRDIHGDHNYDSEFIYNNEVVHTFPAVPRGPRYWIMSTYLYSLFIDPKKNFTPSEKERIKQLVSLPFSQNEYMDACLEWLLLPYDMVSEASFKSVLSDKAYQERGIEHFREKLVSLEYILLGTAAFQNRVIALARLDQEDKVRFTDQNLIAIFDRLARNLFDLGDSGQIQRGLKEKFTLLLEKIRAVLNYQTGLNWGGESIEMKMKKVEHILLPYIQTRCDAIAQGTIYNDLLAEISVSSSVYSKLTVTATSIPEIVPNYILNLPGAQIEKWKTERDVAYGLVHSLGFQHLADMQLVLAKFWAPFMDTLTRTRIAGKKNQLSLKDKKIALVDAIEKIFFLCLKERIEHYLEQVIAEKRKRQHLDVHRSVREIEQGDLGAQIGAAYEAMTAILMLKDQSMSDVIDRVRTELDKAKSFSEALLALANGFFNVELRKYKASDSPEFKYALDRLVAEVNKQKKNHQCFSGASCTLSRATGDMVDNLLDRRKLDRVGVLLYKLATCFYHLNEKRASLPATQRSARPRYSVNLRTIEQNDTVDAELKLQLEEVKAYALNKGPGRRHNPVLLTCAAIFTVSLCVLAGLAEKRDDFSDSFKEGVGAVAFVCMVVSLAAALYHSMHGGVALAVWELACLIETKEPTLGATWRKYVNDSCISAGIYSRTAPRGREGGFELELPAGRDQASGMERV